MATIYTRLGVTEIQAALDALNTLSRDEYGMTLEEVLLDPSPAAEQRLQRLGGITLKRPFAIESGPPAYSDTGARRSWPWSAATPEAQKATAPVAFALLDEFRKPGPWQERTPPAGETQITWDQFKDDVEHERGLFKVLALYVNDKLRRERGKSFKEYLDTTESKRFEAGVDLATLVFDAAVTAPVAAAVGIPTVAVGVALVAIQFGYRLFTEEETGRHGDSHS